MAGNNEALWVTESNPAQMHRSNDDHFLQELVEELAETLDCIVIVNTPNFFHVAHRTPGSSVMSSSRMQAKSTQDMVRSHYYAKLTCA
jgi:hypothetical protein